MRERRKHLGWIAPLTICSALGLAGRDASACGGLFCSAANPVNQAAERIVFAQDESAGRVTAVIEILYQGPAERFAWILPVPGTPEVTVSTNALLNRLQQATNPNYQLQRTWPNSDCEPAPQAVGGAVPPNASDPSVPTDSGSVSVLASGNAGPYDYQVINVAAAMGADPAQEAIDWLTENGYDTGATGPDLLRSYLEAGLNLLAVRLNKQSSVGSIRPIKIAYDGDAPMIPIRPTAVAANRDMGVLVWVLGSARAVPYNYKTLELNEALIDWFNPQQSYNDVIIAAANETLDGQGFVTELARPTNDPQSGNIVDQLFFEQGTIADYRSSADTLTNAELIVYVVNRFATFGNFNFTGPFGGAAPASGQVSLDGVADVLAQNLTLPEGVTVADVLASPACYLEELQTGDAFYCNGLPAPAAGISLVGFDRTQFMTDVEALVIAPIEQTVQLFGDFPYMTRFYTTLSADEMNVDPLFAINTDLPDVSNQHSLSIEYEGCFGTIGAWQAVVNGRIVRGEGNVWPLTLSDEEIPVNLRILQLSSGGQGEVYEDNSAAIGQLLDSRFGDAPMGDGSTPPGMGSPGMGMGTGSGTDTGMDPTLTPPGNGDPMSMRPVGMGSGGACSLGDIAPRRSGSLGLGLFGLFALSALRRRRA